MSKNEYHKQDYKFIMDYFRFRPGLGWKWNNGYKRGFYDHLTYYHSGYKLRPIEGELRDCICVRRVLPAKRFESVVPSLVRKWQMPDDIDF